MIKIKQYFISFRKKNQFDAKTGRWIGKDVSVHMTLSMVRIDV